jgi:general secretion pathway protein G
MKAFLVLGFALIAAGLIYFLHRPCFCMSAIEAAEIFTQKAMPAILERFHQDVGRLPSSREGLAALLRAPDSTIGRWKGPYLEGFTIPKDPWGHEYRYRSRASGAGFEIASLGPDGVISSDDIFVSR